MGASANEQGSFVVDIIMPGAARYTKAFAVGSYSLNTGAFTRIESWAARQSAADVDAIQFLMSTGNINGLYEAYAYY